MRIIYQDASGGCSVFIPSPGIDPTDPAVIAKVVPNGIPYAIVAIADVPSDRSYRNAWVADVANGTIRHDLTKARELHRDYMRHARTPLLLELDIQYMRADEQGPLGNAAKAKILIQKQALRDVTSDTAIEAAQTVEALKTVWPAILGRSPF